MQYTLWGSKYDARKALSLPINMGNVAHVAECETCTQCIAGEDIYPSNGHGGTCLQSGWLAIKHFCQETQYEYVPN